MAEKPQRNYNHRDVDMLIASKTLAENFIAHKKEIIAHRSNWADPFIADFQTRVDNAISKYLGLDPKKDLKKQTQTVNAVQANAIKDLGFFKTQIEEDFKKDKNRLKWILDTLGYTAHWKKVQNKEQEALVELLYKYRQNMTRDLQTEITAKGTSNTLIENIKGYADQLKIANVTQETFKGSSKGLTKEAIDEFNAIYDQSISISKISAKLFKEDKIKADKFTFSKIIKNMGGPRPDNDDEGPADSPTT